MAKKELKLRAVVSPTPVVVASAYSETGKAEACTLAFYMVSSHVPPCVTIAINATLKRKTLQGILANRAFALGFPNIDQVVKADYLGVESGYHTDKLRNLGFTTFEAGTVRAPVINDFPLSLECGVVHSVTVGSHMQITGEVKRILADEDILNGKDRILLEKLRPVIYDEELFRYWSLNEQISEAFRPGLEIKKQLQGEKQHE